MHRTTLHHRHLMFSQQPEGQHQQGGSGQQPQDPKPTEQTPAGTGDAPKDPPADTGRTFTQADLDRILQDRLTTERAKHERTLEEERAKAGKTEAEKYQLERDQALARAGEVTKTAAQRIAKTEAKVAAQALGIRTDRLTALIGQADLTDAIDTDGNVDEAKVQAAVKAAAEQYPEWKTTTGPATPASGGQHNGPAGSDRPTFTRAQIDAMSPDELQAKLTDINEALADGRVTG